MRRLWQALALPVASGLVLVASVSTGATFTDGMTNASNTLSAAVLQPPTDLVVANAPGSRASVTWTATTSAFADGYYIYRTQTSGCCYVQVGTETHLTDTTHTDPSVERFETYYYIVRAYASNWTSVPTAEVAITVD